MNLEDILDIKKQISESKIDNYDLTTKDILFVIPGPGAPGSGGSNTISMFINFLSKNLTERIYIFYYRRCFNSVEEQHQLFLKGYDVNKNVKALEIDNLSKYKFKHIIYTDHYSWFLYDVIRGQKKFVFLQDWEQLFEAAGWESAFAEYNLNKFDIFICASKWLANQVRQLIKNSSKKKIYSFELGIESNLDHIFSLKRIKSNKKKISAYVRTFTHRRCWEIVKEVYKELIFHNSENIELSLFGMDCSDLIKESNFSNHIRNDGLLPKKKLPEYFIEHDLILAFSATNYNLILWDSISVGTPVMDLDIQSTNHIEHPLIIKTSPYPKDICKNIFKTIDINNKKPDRIFVNTLLWDNRISELWEDLKIEFI